jgi:hypothetical protein
VPKKKLRQPRVRVADLTASDATRKMCSLKMDGMVKAWMQLTNPKLLGQGVRRDKMSSAYLGKAFVSPKIVYIVNNC